MWKQINGKEKHEEQKFVSKIILFWKNYVINLGFRCLHEKNFSLPSELTCTQPVDVAWLILNDVLPIAWPIIVSTESSLKFSPNKTTASHRLSLFDAGGGHSDWPSLFAFLKKANTNHKLSFMATNKAYSVCAMKTNVQSTILTEKLLFFFIAFYYSFFSFLL